MKKTMTSLFQGVGTSLELVQLLKDNGRWWLIPFVGVMFCTAGIMIAVSVIEYVAPFVYTIF